PHLRIVLRMFNASLGAGVRRLLGDCEVLSESAIATPAFVASALGDAIPTMLRLPGRPLLVGRREAIPAQGVICGIAAEAGREEGFVSPAGQREAGLVLGVGELPRTGSVRRRAKHPVRIIFRLVGRRLRLLLAILAALVVIGTVVLKFADRLG